MTPTGRQLSALRIARPEEWAAVVREVVGRLGVAWGAQEMGVGLRTAGRWGRQLGMGTTRGGARVGAGRKKKGARGVNQSDNEGV